MDSLDDLPLTELERMLRQCGGNQTGAPDSQMFQNRDISGAKNLPASSDCIELVQEQSNKASYEFKEPLPIVPIA